jgi:hypothetical protein
MLQPNPTPKASRRERESGDGVDRLEVRPTQPADVADDHHAVVRCERRLRGSDQRGTLLQVRRRLPPKLISAAEDLRLR